LLNTTKNSIFTFIKIEIKNTFTFQIMNTYVLTFLFLIGFNLTNHAQEDNYLWLEEIDSQRSLNYVDSLNHLTLKELNKEKDFDSIYKKSLEIYNSDEKIAYPSILGEYVYNFWKDKNHVRGIWRRCLIESYKKNTPNWEILLDIDELSKVENKKWVFKGSTGLYPNYNRFLIQLSNGGGDAIVIREFDVKKKQFLKDGFNIKEAKGRASYIDANTLIVSTNFGEGSQTNSGYPRKVKIWKRGTSINEAVLIHEGSKSDVGNWGDILQDGNTTYTIITRAITFFTSQSYLWDGNETIKMELPEDAKTRGILNNQLIVELKSDWNTNDAVYKKGSLISLNFTELIKGNKVINTILTPNENASISQVSTTKNKLLVNSLINVTSQLSIYQFKDNKWSSSLVEAPKLGTISIVSTNQLDDQYFFDFKNFLTPSTLYYANTDENKFKKQKSLTSYFDANQYEVKQFKTKSKDGTLIPYFIVSHKEMEYNGQNPTLIYAYGGFEVSISPFYSATYGTSWLEKGGILVLANIRGGGEFGPKWHQAGLKENRQNVFDDLYAVSEEMIAKNITSPKHLGVMGGSNGGLLVGVAMTQKPDLYNAVVCQVPLLDMKRFNKLLAGASWMGEYGNPDIEEEWGYLKKYSPYHNLKEEGKYPEVFFYTSTRDDRVHPAHARKMNAKMNNMGYKTYYFENKEGGHAGSSTNEQRAKSNALIFSYLLKKLK
jgi:prolyl oligopeptidase